jgi:hypothetical protein
MFRRAAVVIEEEVEITAVPIQNHREVAMPACEKPVRGAAIEGVTGCKHDAKVAKGDAAIRRNKGTDFWGSQAVLGTNTARFVVIPGIRGKLK